MSLRFTKHATQHDSFSDEFYDRQSVRDLMENDELTAGEEGFMSGYLGAQY